MTREGKTPKEKAKELFEMFRRFEHKSKLFGTEVHQNPWLVAKFIALMTVDEIIQTMYKINHIDAENENTFWLQVKEELNKF